MKKKRLAALALAAVVGIFGALPASAQSALDQILANGKVRIGMDLSAPPFAYTNEKQEPVGSEVETAKLVAKDLGVELEIVPTIAANRIPNLVTGRVDIQMGAFSIFPDRAKSVWFSSPYGTVVSVILAPAATQISSYDDLIGKKVSVARGTYTEQVLIAALPSGAEIVRFDDDSQATAAMAAGQVDAYGVGNVPGYAIIRRFPDRNYEAKISIPPRNWYSFGVKRGETDLLQWLNTFVFFHTQNGDLQRIYKEGIGDELPMPPTL